MGRANGCRDCGIRSQKAVMIVFGIDPGSIYTGFGVIKQQGKNCIRLDSGRIYTGKEVFSERLVNIWQHLNALLITHAPDHVVIEEIFVAKNAQSALKLGQARGVCLLAAKISGAQIHAYNTRLVKKSITGYGQAEKGQMQFMIEKILNLNTKPSEDEADALALALTHIAVGKSEKVKIKETV